MVADKQTLKDLEIFRTSEEGLSLFALLNNSVTSGGVIALKRNLKIR
jgi:DNA mismatch repair ATPase MutS